MFSLTRPSRSEIDRFLELSRPLTFSYEPIGLARGAPGAGYCQDRSTAILGGGPALFDRAWTALQQWRQFDFGWVEIFPAGPPTVPGTNLAVLIRHLGFWSLNGGRIVYTLEDDERTVRRGYAYGTLTNHAERGEEIFEVAMDRASSQVTYSIYAVSRPASLLAWCGYPVARTLQHRFRRDSMSAMKKWAAIVK